MDKKIALSAWEQLLEELDFYDEPPPNFVTLSTFSRGAYVTNTHLMAKIKNGSFQRQYLCATHRSDNRDGRLKIMLNWNALAYDYIASRPASKRPADFRKNSDREYKPLPELQQSKKKKHKKTKPSNTDADTRSGTKRLSHITDLGEAKLEKEKLAILQKQAEIQLGENEVMLVDDVAMIVQGIAHETKSMIRRAINQAAPRVAATSNVITCREIMEDKFRSCLDCLLPLIGDIESLKDACRKTEEESAHDSETNRSDTENIDDSEIVLFSTASYTDD